MQSTLTCALGTNTAERSIQECVLWVSTLARSSEDECERFLKTASDWIGAFMGPNVCVPRFSRVSPLRLTFVQRTERVRPEVLSRFASSPHARSKDRTCAARGSLVFRPLRLTLVQRTERVRPEVLSCFASSPHARSKDRTCAPRGSLVFGLFRLTLVQRTGLFRLTRVREREKPLGPRGPDHGSLT